MTPERGSCVFDAIIAGDAPAHFVVDEADLVGFLDVRPVFPGHTLIVPRQHYPTVAEVPADLAAAIWAAGARVAAAQRQALTCDGTFFGLNDVVSQSVPHVHLHVVPRRFKDGLRGFFWPRGRYHDDAEAGALAAAIRAAIAPSPDPVGPPRAKAPSSGVSIRDAGPGDAAAVSGILAAGSLRGQEDPSRPDLYRAAIDDIRAHPPGAVLVAELGGKVVGLCQLVVFRHVQEQGGLCAEIESVHVAAAHRSQGIGSVLLEAAVERAKQAGCYRVQLTSNKARGDAHRFYLRHGFEASHVGFKRYL